MKGSKIKLLTIVLAIVLVTLVAFCGVYTQVQNRMENQVKDYEYAMDIKGARDVALKVSTGSEEVIKDSEGKEVENADQLTDEEIEEKGYVKEEVKDNSDDVLTKENYEKSKTLIEERLKKDGAQQYIVRLNEETGEIQVQLEENANTDDIIGDLVAKNKFEIVDKDTGELLMDNNDLDNVQVMYSSGDGVSSGTTVYLSIQFNKEGTAKLADISGKYTPAPSTTPSATPEASEEGSSEENTTVNVDENGNTTTEDKSEEQKDKEIILKVSGEEVLTTSFDEVINNGALQLSYGQASTDKDTINENAQKASDVAKTLNSNVMPIVYEVDRNKFVESNFNKDLIKDIAIIVAGVIAVALIILVIKYKLKGFLTAIAYVGFVSLYSILLRYTNVVISINGLVSILLILILNYIFMMKLLKNVKESETVKEASVKTYKNFFIIIAPVIIMSLVFCFINWVPVSGFGMISFWGIFLIIVYNYLITNTLLNTQGSEDAKGGTSDEK